MHKMIDCRIRGIAPMMQHNGQLADPLNEYAKAMRVISGKRKKTDADHMALADLEWEGSLYLDDKSRVIVPGENIEAMMIDAGKKLRLGEACKAGILCDGEWLLEHDGPKDLAKLKADPRFRDRRAVRVQQNKVMRTRPIFVSWALDFRIHYLPDLLNESQVIDMLSIAGRIVGLGEYLPKYGRFLIDDAGAGRKVA